MEDSSNNNSNSSRDLKKRLCILEDENGLELSLGLSLGNSSSDSKRPTDPPPPLPPAPAADGASAATDEEQQPRAVRNSGNPWFDARRKSPADAFRLRDFIPDVSQQIASAWPQMNKDPPAAARVSHPSGIPMSEIAKYLAASAKQPVQSQTQAEPPPAAAATGDEDQTEIESSEQHKKFSQHQEARKKRKMAMDEQKKKPREDDKPDESPSIQRVASLGAFHNRGLDQTSASMAALTSQLMSMRRTTSDPSLVHALQQQQQKEDSSKDQAGQEAENSNGVNSNNNNNSESLLGMWQLGTTVDVPSAENINPELSSIKPGCSADLPWVAASGPGGKSVSGVAYKLFQGQYKIVCSCHGLHMSPAEFVRHAAGSGNGGGGGGGLTGGDAISMLSQVAPA